MQMANLAGKEDALEQNAVVMGVVRCGLCGRKLCEIDLYAGSIRIKCRCGRINIFSHVNSHVKSESLEDRIKKH